MARDSLTAEGIAELFKEVSTHIFLTLLEVNHSSIPDGPYRFVNNQEDITYNSNVYSAAGFELSLPTDEAENVPTVEITLPSVDRVIVNGLRALAADERPDVTINIVRIDNVGTVTLEIGPLNFKLLNYTVSSIEINLSLGYEQDFLNMPATSPIYSPAVAPGLFG